MGKNDYVGGGIFTGLGVFIWVYTWHFPVLIEAGGRHPGPSLFPRVLASLFLLFGLAVILNGWRAGRSKTVPREEGAAGLKLNYFNPVLIIVLIIAFIILAPKLGFLITATAILSILMMKLQVRPIRSLVISAVLTCFVYFTFAKLLRVPLPIGLLGW
ncbi:MAG: tripartite tricarboxylate transporter TctB family protein [Desulfobacteraceae bacterium]|nr:MAG: tripartite tricarboxylate transporter TctB family protein [Desulfobacteraceae bacterium]